MFANGFSTGSYEEQVSCCKVPPLSVILDIFNRGSRVFAFLFVREDKRHWIPDYERRA